MHLMPDLTAPRDAAPISFRPALSLIHDEERIEMSAQRITTLRKRFGFTQSELALRLNLTPSALGNYEQGRRLPSIETLVLMAELFDVSLDFLITGKEHPGTALSSERPDCPCATCYWASRTSTP